MPQPSNALVGIASGIAAIAALASSTSLSFQSSCASGSVVPPSTGTVAAFEKTSIHGRLCANCSKSDSRSSSWSLMDVPDRPDRSVTKTTHVGRCSRVAIVRSSILLRSKSARLISPGVSVTMCRSVSTKKCPILMPLVVNG